MGIIISFVDEITFYFWKPFYHAVRREYNNAIFVHNDIGLSIVIKKDDQKFLYENGTNVRLCL